MENEKISFITATDIHVNFQIHPLGGQGSVLTSNSSRQNAHILTRSGKKYCTNIATETLNQFCFIQIYLFFLPFYSGIAKQWNCKKKGKKKTKQQHTLPKGQCVYPQQHIHTLWVGYSSAFHPSGQTRRVHPTPFGYHLGRVKMRANINTYCQLILSKPRDELPKTQNFRATIQSTKKLHSLQ